MRYTPRAGRVLAAFLAAIATFEVVAVPDGHHPALVGIARAVAVLDYALAAVHLRIAHNLARRSRGKTSTTRT